MEGAISDALTAIERKAEEKLTTVTSKIEPSVGLIVGNQFSIGEMLKNLPFNAIEYTPEKKSVHIQAKSRGDDVQIDISDTGIGIPDNKIGSIFDEFFSAGNGKKTPRVSAFR